MKIKKRNNIIKRNFIKKRSLIKLILTNKLKVVYNNYIIKSLN